MPRSNVPPRGNQPLKDWALDASAKVLAAVADYGTTTERAQEFSDAAEAFASAFATAIDPATRTIITINAARQAKSVLLDIAGPLMRTISVNPEVSESDRLKLGLPVPQPRTPHQAPTNTPDLDIRGVTATSVSIRAHNGNHLVRRLPPQVMGMMVYTFVGEPPMDFLQWQSHGPFTRPTATIDFGTAVGDGARVWIAVRWFNRHGNGPISLPQEIKLAGLTLSQQMSQQMNQGQAA